MSFNLGKTSTRIKDFKDLDAQVPDLFPGRKRFELEIGPGKGMYILARAGQDPGWGFLAIEVRHRFVRRIRERALKHGLDNILVIHSDARRILPHLRPDRCLDRVCLHFPDPWWKKRHRKRAILTGETLDHIVRLLRRGGEAYMQTDVFDRAIRILRALTDHEALENTAGDGGLLEHAPFECTSNRERICMDASLPVFRMLFRKK